ncbi:MAG: murein biosynthesis integral membrane protein MurJ [Solirubrobacterales bacterium]|nr:murein biosynthesis integral membrane protein MurJ [Solirubrobacterales bacterium]
MPGEDQIHDRSRASESGGGRRLALSTAIFSFATALSRVAGLIREIVAAVAFGVTGAVSAFTVAFNVPNLVRSLFADAALQAAFVPVFTELLDRGERKEAFKVASTLFYLIVAVLGLITIGFIIAAPWIMPLFAFGLDDQYKDLMIGLSRVLFPSVVLLGVTGLFAGILNALDHFAVPAIAPLFWNVVIILSIVLITPYLAEGDRIYAYAIGVLLGTIVQMLMPIPVLRRKLGGEEFGRSFDWRNKNVHRVLILMMPVAIGLGLINFDVAVNNLVGSLVSDEAPAAIDKAFRIFMLPQGIFSVAIATVLFPTLSRFAARQDFNGLRHTMANGVRQMFMVLVPSAAIIAVLATPIVKLVFQHGKFDAADTELVATALFWFTFSLPFHGANLLYTRTFFSLQRPWLTTLLALGSLSTNLIASLVLYKTFGIAGVVGATAIATLGMMIAQAMVLRKPLGGVEGRETIVAFFKIVLASVPLALVSYGLWYALDSALGDAIVAQSVSLGVALIAGGATYAAAVYALRIEEARQVSRLIVGRLRR